MAKPIKVFFSELGNRFYASAAYKETPHPSDPNKVIFQITGKKYDVTNDIAAAIKSNDITFEKVN